MADSLIVFQDEDLLVADKPHGITTVPLKGQDMAPTLLGMVSRLCPAVLSVSGKNAWEHGAVHRLDTATSGLVVFTKNQRTYDLLLDLQARDLISKTYRAVVGSSDRLKGQDVSGSLASSGRVEISTYFRSYGPGAKAVRPTMDVKRADVDRLYSTLVEVVEPGSIFSCTITRGFRHQIRAHLAWIGHPIIGDVLYGDGKDGDTLMLDCTQIMVSLPGGKKLHFSK